MYQTHLPYNIYPLCISPTTLNAYNYIYMGNGLTIQQPYSMYLVQDPDHGTNVVGVMKIGNIVPRAEIKPTYLASQASVLQ